MKFITVFNNLNEIFLLKNVILIIKNYKQIFNFKLYFHKLQGNREKFNGRNKGILIMFRNTCWSAIFGKI